MTPQFTAVSIKTLQNINRTILMKEKLLGRKLTKKERIEVQKEHGIRGSILNGSESRTNLI